VSRGGVKLAFALDHFGIAVEGRNALDVGASTGGFSHVLLSRDAHHVTALDVGHGQLHPSLQKEKRLTSLEGVDVRTITLDALPAMPDLLVMDVSFIPLHAALPPALALTNPLNRADAVILIKPQFEAGKKHIGKGGIVKDPEVHARVCEDATELVTTLDWQVDGVIPSPITGGEGNIEFLLAAHRDPIR
jgi:23S rRNA (cytidine1920-2'-O)/16S rRNA (cytidine1409-2'-O)-methyltransferase